MKLQSLFGRLKGKRDYDKKLKSELEWDHEAWIGGKESLVQNGGNGMKCNRDNKSGSNSESKHGCSL